MHMFSELCPLLCGPNKGPTKIEGLNLHFGPYMLSEIWTFTKECHLFREAHTVKWVYSLYFSFRPVDKL